MRRSWERLGLAAVRSMHALVEVLLESFGGLPYLGALRRVKITLERFISKRRLDHRTVVVPPQQCFLCCAGQGSDRLKVVFVRNPFVRVVSYFRMNWINNTRQHPDCTTWSCFEDFIGRILKVKTETDAFESLRVPLHAEATSMNIDDLIHLRSVDAWFNDKFLRVPLNQTDFHIVHLETLGEDFARFKQRLCAEFSFCAQLPPFPHIHSRNWVLDRNWAGIWTPNATAMLLQIYRKDFETLGYVNDPMELQPVGPVVF